MAEVGHVKERMNQSVSGRGTVTCKCCQKEQGMTHLEHEGNATMILEDLGWRRSLRGFLHAEMLWSCPACIKKPESSTAASSASGGRPAPDGGSGVAVEWENRLFTVQCKVCGQNGAGWLFSDCDVSTTEGMLRKCGWRHLMSGRRFGAHRYWFCPACADKWHGPEDYRSGGPRPHLMRSAVWWSHYEWPNTTAQEGSRRPTPPLQPSDAASSGSSADFPPLFIIPCSDEFEGGVPGCLSWQPARADVVEVEQVVALEYSREEQHEDEQ